MDCRNEGVSIIIVFVTTCYKHSSPPTEALRSVRRLGCSKIYGLTDLTGGLPWKRNAIERRWYSENDRAPLGEETPRKKATPNYGVTPFLSFALIEFGKTRISQRYP